MPARSLLLAATVAAALTATAAPALALPPANDNYLQSTAINEPETPLQPTFKDTLDTTEATTQPDLFNPGPQGQPFTGGGMESTRCGGTFFGKTVWWDFHPPVDGGVEIKTAAGFDNVVTVYEWSQDDSRIVRTVGCQNDSPGVTEDMILPDEVRKGRAYTVQVGGVAAGGLIGGGPLQFELDYFRDTDGDGFLDDEGDKCRRTPGPRRSGGCPPQLKGKVGTHYQYVSTPTGIRFRSFVVDGLPRHARIAVRCGRGCRTIKMVARHRKVSVKRLLDRDLSQGTRLRLQVTLGRQSKGRYRYGATGLRLTWSVGVGALHKHRDRCLHVRSDKVQKCR